MPHRGDGPIPTRIMIVGEAWGADEEREGRPFVGASGQELNRMLHEAGIMRSECFVTNLVNRRPPSNDFSLWAALKKKDRTAQHVQLFDRWVLPLVVEGYKQLWAEIDAVQPNLIISVGNWSMWALTAGEAWGITKWRGSQLRCKRALPAGQGLVQEPKLIPTIHPASVLREWSQRAAVVTDLRRAKRHMETREYNPPKWNFIIRPNFDQAIATLEMLLKRVDAGETWIDFDIETRAGHIACIGLSWTRLDAICIPLMCVENREGYWSVEEETQIIWRVYRLLSHRNVRVRWQNGLYDAQYEYRHHHFVPRGGQDTMISQHAIFSDLPKSLSFQASLYCDWYVYWKEEGKNWDKKMGEDQLWYYNCLDCIYTREVGEVELQLAEKMGLKAVHDFQQSMFWPVLKAMQRGVRVIKENRSQLAMEIQEQIDLRQALLEQMVGREINPRSSTQMQDLFYRELAQPVIMSKAKKGSPPHPTCDDEALQKIARREPLMRPLVNCIADIRTLGVFLSNFVLAPLDIDGRMRCSYNIGGSESGKSAPKTYRLSSSENAFGSGTNLQNIPSEKSKSVGKAVARGHMAMLGDPYALPNVRSLFGPDPGFTFFDLDLDRADLYSFVWEIDDKLFKEVLRRGVDAHLLHVYLLDGQEPPPLDELIESHPKYWDHRGPRKYKREFSKVFCHAVDYYAQERTLAAATGRTVHEVSKAKKRYLSLHPNIEPYWEEVKRQVQSRRYVENKFSYRWYIFDRVDSCLPEAIAWIPQSTTSIVINKIWHNFYHYLPEVWVLMQVHDSLAGQFPTHRKDHCLAEMKRLSAITIPYDDPLVIPTSVGTSEVSWGEC